jgi:Tfp pilus assembly protein PilO
MGRLNMGGSAGVMARFLVIAFFAVVGMGVWTFMINTDLEAARDSLASTQKDNETWKTRLSQYQSEGQSDATNLQQCQGKVQDLQSQMEALNTKKPAGKK